MRHTLPALLAVGWLLVPAAAAIAHEGHHPEAPAAAREAPAAAPPAPADREPPSHPWGHSGLGHLASWFGQLHVVAVHFPVALLLAAGAAEVLLARRRIAWLAGAVRFCVTAGALLAAVAAALGWLAAGPVTQSDDWLVTAHRWSGSTTALLALGLLALSERAARSGERRSLRVALAFVALSVIATGFLGGSLVHGIDHLAWPTP